LQIAFTSSRSGNWQIYTMNVDGSNQYLLANDKAKSGEPNWEP
jgi:TolB protein